MNAKNLIPGNTYRLWFKNERSLTAEFTSIHDHNGINKYRFVVCDSAVLWACEWDFLCTIKHIEMISSKRFLTK
mgnify:CR=1 FL=1